MLNQRLQTAQNVAEQLFSAETLIEDAILRTSRLAIAIVEGRQTARLPITAGQHSLNAIAVVAASLVKARGEIAVAHVALAEDKVKMGLGTRSMGDWGECPDAVSQPSGEAAPPLKVVA